MSRTGNPRLAAQKAILAIENGRLAQEALADCSKNLSRLDAALCADLVYGLLRSRSVVSERLAGILRKPASLPQPMLASLELAAYSLLHQDKAKNYAVVDETVKIVKKRYGRNLANVANAALRRLAEAGESGSGNAPAIPPEIIDIWHRTWPGQDIEPLIRRSSCRPFRSLRLNPLHENFACLNGELEANSHAARIAFSGFSFPPGKMPQLLSGYPLEHWRRLGALSFQSAGSQTVLEKLGIRHRWRNIPVWDACAGVGGKTVAMLEAGLLARLATDLSFRRLAVLPSECARLGLEPPAVAVADACRPPLREWHGNILLDAPCSGLGVLASRPDIRQRFKLENIGFLVKIQGDILRRLSDMLLPGKELAYITCTLNIDENEKQIAGLLRDNKDMELAAQWQTPLDHPWLDGMYGALIRRRPG